MRGEYFSPVENWVYASGPELVWQNDTTIQLSDRLTRQGYSRKGGVETVREATMSPELEQVLRTTAAFKLEGSGAWPERRFTLHQIYYSPLATCALFLFHDKASARDSYRYKLARVDNPGIRRVRARAHISNGLLLYGNSDLYGALEETGIAAAMDPIYPSACYHYALLLAAHGRFDEALGELKAAFRLEPDLKEKARKALEFKDLRKDDRFKALLQNSETP